MALGTVAAALFAQRARSRPEMRASAEVLSAMLQEPGYPVHASVPAFEAAWGGILLGDGPDDEPHGARPGHVLAKRCDLVPRRRGNGMDRGTIVGPGPTRCTRTGERMIADALLTSSMWRRTMRSFEIEGAIGANMAAALSLPAIEEASDDLVGWWGDGATLIVELANADAVRVTRAVSDDPALLELWR